LIGRYLPTSDFRQLVLLQLCGSAVICTLILPMLETPFLVWDFSIAAYLFVTGVLATGLAIYVQNRAQQYTTPNRTALIFSLEPFCAALVAYQILGQSLSAKEWAGGILVLAGILTSEFRRNRVTS
jgi:drug/metabolite transporter (DMT)-like permease